MTRPYVRMALAIAPIVLLAAGWLVYQEFVHRTDSYVFKLTKDAPSSAKVVLVRDGKLMVPIKIGEKILLEPGRYEIYVNERYTGRVVTVPSPTKSIDDIPFVPTGP